MIFWDVYLRNKQNKKKLIERYTRNTHSVSGIVLRTLLICLFHCYYDLMRDNFILILEIHF